MEGDMTWVKGEQVKYTKEKKKSISFCRNFSSFLEINYLKISIRLLRFFFPHLLVYEDKRPFQIFITIVLVALMMFVCIPARDNTPKISLKGMLSFTIHEIKVAITIFP